MKILQLKLIRLTIDHYKVQTATGIRWLLGIILWYNFPHIFLIFSSSRLRRQLELFPGELGTWDQCLRGREHFSADDLIGLCNSCINSNITELMKYRVIYSVSKRCYADV